MPAPIDIVYDIAKTLNVSPEVVKQLYSKYTSQYGTGIGFAMLQGFASYVNAHPSVFQNKSVNPMENFNQVVGVWEQSPGMTNIVEHQTVPKQPQAGGYTATTPASTPDLPSNVSPTDYYRVVRELKEQNPNWTQDQIDRVAKEQLSYAAKHADRTKPAENPSWWNPQGANVSKGMSADEFNAAVTKKLAENPGGLSYDDAVAQVRKEWEDSQRFGQNNDYFNDLNNSQMYLNNLLAIQNGHTPNGPMGFIQKWVNDGKSRKFVEDYEKRYEQTYGTKLDRNKVMPFADQYSYQNLAGMDEDTIYKTFMDLAHKWYGNEIHELTQNYLNMGITTPSPVDTMENVDLQLDGFERIKRMVQGNKLPSEPTNPDYYIAMFKESSDPITFDNVQGIITTLCTEYYANAAFKEWLREMLDSGQLEVYARQNGSDDLEYAKQRYSGIDTTMNEIKAKLTILYNGMNDVVAMLDEGKRTDLGALRPVGNIQWGATGDHTSGMRIGPRYDDNDDKWHSNVSYSGAIGVN